MKVEIEYKRRSFGRLLYSEIQAAIQQTLFTPEQIPP